jgi:NAD(P)H-flavin reductase
MNKAASIQEPAQAVGRDPMIPELFRVKQTRRETRDTFTLELEPIERSLNVAFRPGQFNMLYPFGVGECAISISGDPLEPRKLLHTTRVVGGVTKALYALKPGDRMGIRGPFGTSWPIVKAEGNDVVFVAGGIGLAPLRPAIYHVLSHRMKFGKVVLLYGARTPDDIVFRREIETWSSRLDVEVFVTVDRAGATWRGNVGVVPAMIRRAPFDRLNAVAMVCGPELMMHFAAQELLKRGVPAERVFISMERNMKCGIGLCGHCQFGPTFICKDGPIFGFDRIQSWFERREI